MKKGLASLLILILIFSCGDRLFAVTEESFREEIVFFGDSTTAHLAVRGGIPREQVWSGQTGTVLFETVNTARCVYIRRENRSYTVAEAAARFHPAILVVTVGVSGGAGRLPRAAFVAIYRELITSIRQASPETRLYVQSILPLSDRSVRHYRRLTKEAVTEANGWIEALCRELSVPYINTHPLLTDESGYLKPAYQNDECLHLTAAAYTVVLDSVYSRISSDLREHP